MKLHKNSYLTSFFSPLESLSPNNGPTFYLSTRTISPIDGKLLQGGLPLGNTPNIDALAEKGVRFTHAYIGTWCMPSRATMLTGHHQYGVESMRMEGEYPGSVYDPEKCPFWLGCSMVMQPPKLESGIRESIGYGRDWDHQMVWSRPKYPQNAGNISTSNH